MGTWLITVDTVGLVQVREQSETMTTLQRKVLEQEQIQKQQHALINSLLSRIEGVH